MRCTVTWNGQVYPVECPEPAAGTDVAVAFLSGHEVWLTPLAAYGLFDAGDGQEVMYDDLVADGASLVLRPRAA